MRRENMKVLQLTDRSLYPTYLLHEQYKRSIATGIDSVDNLRSSLVDQ